MNLNVGTAVGGDTNTITATTTAGATLTTALQNTNLEADQIVSADKIRKLNIAEGTSQNGKPGVGSTQQKETSKEATKSLKSGADQDTTIAKEDIKGVDN